MFSSLFYEKKNQMVKDDEEKILFERMRKRLQRNDKRNNLFWKFFNKKKQKIQNNETNTPIYFSPSLRVPLVGILGCGECCFMQIIFKDLCQYDRF